MMTNVPLALRVIVVGPAGSSDNTAHVGVGENGPGGSLPCPSQEGAIARSSDGAVDEGVTSVLGVALPCLSCDHGEAAVSEHVQLSVEVERCPRPKDEVHSALNVAVLEEVEAPVVTDRVLKPQEPAIVEGRFVSGDPRGHCLCSRSLPVWPRRRVL